MNDSDKEKFVKELKSALDVSSAQVRNLQMIFLLFLVFIGATAWNTTHVMLLKDSPITLPTFNIQLNLQSFYFGVPFLLIIFHLDLLLNLNEHAATLHKWQSEAGKNADRELLYPFAFNYVLVDHQDWGINIFFKLFTWATAYLLPLAVLLLIQMTYLPYHSYKMTYLHGGAVTFDAILCVYFWLSLRRGKTEKANINEEGKTLWVRLKRPLAKLRSALHSGLAYLPIVLVIYLCFFVIRIPQNQSDRYWLDAIGIKDSGFSDRLYIHGEALYKAPPDTAVIEIMTSQGISKEEIWRTETKGMDLHGKDLRFARFEKVIFVHVDLQKAQLQGVALQEVQMQRGDLRETQLQGASLSGAQLQGANLSGAQLQGANLNGAQLQGADLSGAQLQGADLSEAHLKGADLNKAQLQGAILQRAHLKGADLQRAHLQGADLGDAQMQGADLREAKLLGVLMPGAEALIGLLIKGIDTTSRDNTDWNGFIKKMKGVGIAKETISRIENAKIKVLERQAKPKKLQEVKDDLNKFMELNKELALEDSYIAEHHLEKAMHWESKFQYSPKYIQDHLSDSMKAEIRARGRSDLLDYKYER
jgi:uncharacterized protein YjbI with pentapeptide repeats